MRKFSASFLKSTHRGKSHAKESAKCSRLTCAQKNFLLEKERRPPPSGNDLRDKARNGKLSSPLLCWTIKECIVDVTATVLHTMNGVQNSASKCAMALWAMKWRSVGTIENAIGERVWQSSHGCPRITTTEIQRMTYDLARVCECNITQPHAMAVLIRGISWGPQYKLSHSVTENLQDQRDWRSVALHNGEQLRCL